MEVEEKVVAEAAQYLLAAFHRSKPTGLRCEAISPLEVDGELDNFIQKICFRVRALVEMIEHEELYLDRACPSALITCRPQDLLIFEDTSAVVEPLSLGKMNEALSMRATQDANVRAPSAQGFEHCDLPSTTSPTLESQLESTSTHRGTRNGNQAPQENEHNGASTVAAQRPTQLRSKPSSEKYRKRWQTDGGPVHKRSRGNMKLASRPGPAQSVQLDSELLNVLAKLVSPRIILQLREIAGRFPTSKISIGLNVSEVGFRDLFDRIIERERISQTQALAQYLDIHHLYKMFYQQISGQRSRAFEVLTARSIRTGLSGNPFRRREKAVTERIVETMLSELDPVRSTARSTARTSPNLVGDCTTWVTSLGSRSSACLCLREPRRRMHWTGGKTRTDPTVMQMDAILLTIGRLFLVLDSDFKRFLKELRTSAHFDYLQNICRDLSVVVEFLRRHERGAEAVPLHTLDMERISQCGDGAQELSDAVRQACQVATI